MVIIYLRNCLEYYIMLELSPNSGINNRLYITTGVLEFLRCLVQGSIFLMIDIVSYGLMYRINTRDDGCWPMSKVPFKSIHISFQPDDVQLTLSGLSST